MLLAPIRPRLWPAMLLAALLVLLLAWLPLTAHAAVPNDSAHPAYAEEQTILQVEKDLPEPGFGDAASGREHFDRHYIIPPGFMPEQDVILQRGGNTWRVLRNGSFATIFGVLVLVVPLLLFGFYRAFGPARLEHPATGRKIQRFSDWDRLIHWTTAIAFLTMAITGLIVLFGKKVLLPWMGHEVFSWFAVISKYLHNFVGPLFIACSIILFFNFVRKNRFVRGDWIWIRKAGGMASHEHVPTGYFNPGEKLWFWGGVTLLGLVMSLTGLMLDFPYFINTGANTGFTRYLLQMSNYFHLAGATLYIIAAMGHIYLGTLGTPGAYEAMRYGTVDEEWARTHHELWYDEVQADSRRTVTPGRPIPPGTTPRPGS
ncbi:formate dehydrogenase subunit gamma [Noviherbaspirillum sp.]|uniref:formate dehydrogenase subunit gamma n=1 Tax=Noviherbaspirillum sp. TaxID=1926288 RepID=UPI0025F8C144|nr:formate dehydrogenase subunit gamma [Noviherbaspirillum sp.]